MNETGKIEDPADKSNGERISDAEDLQDGENNEEAEGKKVIHDTDYCTYQLTRTSSSLDCRDSKEALSKLSSLNSGMFMSESLCRKIVNISRNVIKSHSLISFQFLTSFHLPEFDLSQLNEIPFIAENKMRKLLILKLTCHKNYNKNCQS